ncbi:MAG: FtsQ-type POTRA domain-containing protein [Clostridia bacterium]|nr:FtsQ-type POTRA domain-containing protein [Clostridia bacterium]
MNKKIVVVLCSAVVFFAAAVLGFGISMSVNEYTVTGTIYSDEAKENVAKAQESINERLGTNLLFVSEQEFYDVFSAYPYLSVLSVEKKFPDKVIVTIEEKMEVYAVSCADGTYCMADRDGVILAISSVNQNNLDERQNVLLEGFSVASPVLGGKLGETVAVTFAGKENNGFFTRCIRVLDAFHDAVGGLRACAEKVVCVSPTLNEKDENVTVLSYDGVSISIDHLSYYGEEKALAAARLFDSLSDTNKLFGTINAVDDSSGESYFRCTYTARK